MLRMAMAGGLLLLYSVLVCSVPVAFGATDPNDYAILDAFRKGLDNPELLKWPSNNEDACGPPLWPHVFCSGDRVTQIQVQELGLKGPLPQNLNQLPELYNLGLQKNSFTGPLPSFSGLSKLQYVYLDYNQFDSIPMDFFDGLTNLQAISLDQNPFNKSTGWALPKALQDSAQLQNFSCSQCNLVGPMPNFIGSMASLTNLRLAYNSLTGEIPASLGGSNLQTLILNNQAGDGLTGPIDILASMASLSVVWLHGNSLTGTIPENITACTSLTDLRLNNNKLTGVVPASLGTMKQLQVVKLDNNLFMGPTPNLKIQNLSYAFNSFCLSTPGIPCSPEVTALLDFLNGVNYPAGLAEGWTGNDPCAGPWLGINCFSGKVSGINLPNRGLSGFISPSLGKLDGLVNIRLDRNKLVGRIPTNLTGLKSLKMLNLTSNNLSPPIPRFSSGMTLLTDQNPLLDSPNSPAPSPGNSAPGSSAPGDSPQSPSQNPPTSSNGSSSPSASSGGSYSPNMGTPNSAGKSSSSKGFDSKKVVVIASSVAAAILISSLLVFCLLRQRKKKDTFVAPGSIVVHPRDSSDPENMVKIVIADSVNKSITGSELQSARASNGTSDSHVIDSGNLKISVKILRSVTRNFSSENELGRGGFGVVYKGELHDGTMIAVKRMEASIISNKALDEFHSEIAVLSKVRHRNLVSLLGYSVEGLERLLVYEYMPQGALSKHLFHWRNLNIEPLSWKKRLNIALDVARGMEYLHNLAHQSFIHRDLKSSNILLGDDYRAKISDFGLVKLAPDGKNSVTTRLAGTFGYLAPEYAVTGKITTKADVFSFGVVLMEIVTGLTALDEDRPEETRYLASWFFEVKSSKEKLIAAIDPTINVTEETFESISVVAELAGHCAAREPQQRPDMGHAVNVLAPLVEKWKPTSDNQEEYMGIDLRQPLLQMVKGWQDADCSNMSSMSLDDSKGSIPARPNGFAESFTSADGR